MMSPRSRKITIWSITIILATITIAVSIWLYPGWTQNPAGIIGMAAAVFVEVIGVVEFLDKYLLPGARKTGDKMTREQRRDVREHLKFGLLQEHKNLLNSFYDQYLGDGAPAPFGGRDAQMAALDRWLDNPDGPSYMLLTAPAGRGKTLLVVQWAARLITRAETPPRVILAPVSIRFNTAQPEIHLQILARALAQYYHDPIQESPGDTRQTWRGVCAKYLSQKEKPAREQLLVILDGLDESNDADPEQWRALVGDLPAGTRVLLSARWLGDERDESGWRGRLGLNPARASHLNLPLLDQDGLRQVVESMGSPLSGFAREHAIARELLRLTGGDPLLVRLYAQDLQVQMKQAAQGEQSVDDREALVRLKEAEPDLKGYFKGWWHDQRKQWKAQGEDVDAVEDDLRELLRVLAAAFAPLDGQAVAELIGGLKHPYQQERLAERAPRIISGSGSTGYTLSHPKFGIYFYEGMDGQERAAVEERFITAGRKLLAALKDGSLQPATSPKYFILHSKDHLLRAIREGRAQPEDLYALLCEPWLRAHEHHSGAPASFLEDAKAAWQIASQQPDGAPGVQALALLCFSSVATLSGHIPGEVIAAGYQEGILNQAQALAYIRQDPGVDRRFAGLICLAEVEKDQARQERLLAEALEVSRQMGDADAYASALAEASERLPADQAWIVARQIESARLCANGLIKVALRLPVDARQAALAEALEVARKIEDAYLRASTMAEMITAFLPERQEAVCEEALGVADQIRDRYWRIIAIVKIAPALSPAGRNGVLQEALMTAHRIDDSFWSAGALSDIAPLLPDVQRGGVLDEALVIARSIADPGLRARAEARIALRLPVEQQEQIFSEALKAVAQVKYREDRSRVLVEMIPYLPVAQALDAARQIGDADLYARALVEVAQRLPDDQRQEILDKALEAVRQIAVHDLGARALAEVARRLPADQRREVLVMALADARQIADQYSIHSALAKFLPGLAGEQAFEIARRFAPSYSRDEYLAQVASLLPVSQAFEAASLIEASYSRGKAMAEIASRLPTDQGLNVIRLIDDEFVRASALVRLSGSLPDEQQSILLGEVIEFAREIADPETRAYTLAEIGIHAPVKQALEIFSMLDSQEWKMKVLAYSAMIDLPGEQVLAAARNIVDPIWRARAMVTLVSRLPADQQSPFAGEVLEMVLPVENSFDREQMLAEIGPHLTVAQVMEVIRPIEDALNRSRLLAKIAVHLPVAQALETVEQITEPGWRSYAMVKIAPRLPTEQALEIARQSGDAGLRIEALAAISARLSGEQQDEVLCEAVEAVDQVSADMRGRALAAIARYLPAEPRPAILNGLLDAIRRLGGSPSFISQERLVEIAGALPAEQAIEIASQIWDSDKRDRVMAEIVPRMPSSRLPGYWQEGIDGLSVKQLGLWVPRWQDICSATGIPQAALFSKTLRAFQDCERRTVLELIGALEPVIAQLGGEAALLQTVGAIQAAAKWWP